MQFAECDPWRTSLVHITHTHTFCVLLPIGNSEG